MRARVRTTGVLHFLLSQVSHFSHRNLIINKIRRQQGERSFSVTKSTSKRIKTSTHLKKNDVLFLEKGRVTLQTTMESEEKVRLTQDLRIDNTISGSEN